MMSLQALGKLSSARGAIKLIPTYYKEHSADYCVRDFDYQGVWMGQGTKSLGLEGVMNRQEFKLSLVGYVEGHQVLNAGKKNRQIGWDLTFSAPKSVSIVWAGAEVPHKQEIQQAQQRATDAAFDYLEANTITRRGKGGSIHERAKLVASRFIHYISRAGDPQLHSHVVVSNFSVRNDGTVGTIDSHIFYRNKMAAGALYQVELAWQMQKLGYKIEQGIKGTFRLSDVSPDAERLFSKRRKQIVDLIKERGIKNYAGTRGIVLATRLHTGNFTLSEREETWEREARENGVHLKAEHDGLKLAPVKSDDQILMQASQRLTLQQSTFKENVLLCDIALASIGFRNATEVRELIKEAQDKGHVVKLDSGVLTTPNMPNIEKGIITYVESMVKKDIYSVNGDKVIEEGVLAENGEKLEFSEEQKKIAIRAATGSSGIAVIQGRAKEGNAIIIAAVGKAYIQEGWKVEGITISARAAQDLKKGTGIESETIHSWLLQKEIGNHSVIIMDDARTAGSQQIADVLQKVDSVRGEPYFCS